VLWRGWVLWHVLVVGCVYIHGLLPWSWAISARFMILEFDLVLSFSDYLPRYIRPLHRIHLDKEIQIEEEDQQDIHTFSKLIRL
jgi:hypothetical protein